MKIKTDFFSKVYAALIVVMLLIFSLQNSFLIKFSDIYTLLGYVSIVLLALLIFIKKKSFNLFIKNKVVVIIFFLAVLQLIIVLFLKGLGQTDNIPYVRDIFLILTFIYLGFNEEDNYFKYLFYFTVFLSLSALSIIIFVAGGLTISEQYLSIPKNQIAPIFVQGIISGIFYLNGIQPQKAKRYITFISLAILVVTLLILRGRTAMLALALCSILYIFLYIKSRKNKLFVLIAIISSIIYFLPTIYKSFFLNYDINEKDSFTAGRTSVYDEALVIISKNPLTGKLFQSSDVSSQIHNYLLSIYFELGIFAIPLLIIYAIMMYQTYKMIKLRKISGLLLVVLFITSLSEYTFPYAPGSATFFAFFLYGMNFKSLR
ncbi:O-antigen ligase family protein [Elizabethkingia anophelis]|uniref:O-antigen ligase family protein n=1 Tax=Elizabethkingia anophelis TaxID=1117645 RepID=UPI000442CCD2|nr:O-antigen ligase family protein [Elizabethkingia anophelis]AVF48055.1 O-antigen ligase domain-containing protein [Elizabethkingia anophelis]AVF52049.1 O-antigen ligase domain-containing protein [Elizabethkingia anophelis]MBG0505665.1 O-antigen ligase family protein [Elizabethkingia anophelis]MCT3816424.1 O-antigen ligase family protein [Elizabethkingia anophelis]MCT3873662.1 O-antigen ligase family protein [Elizabethkingia anophelis]